jgi:hypothetical protein
MRGATGFAELRPVTDQSGSYAAPQNTNLFVMDDRHASSLVVTIHVRLTDEMVKVWRPVAAIALDADRYRIADQVIPEDEIWEFRPGQIVIAAEQNEDSGTFLVALHAAD